MPDPKPEIDVEEVELQETADSMLRILDEYEDPDARELAKAELMAEFGIDPDTKTRVELNADPESDPDPEPEPDPEGAKAAEPEGEGEGDEKKADEGEGKEGDDPAGDPANDELEQIRNELRESRQRIAELEGRQQVNEADVEIRAEADKVVAAARAEFETEKTTTANRIEDFKETYGEEAAKVLIDEAERTQKLRSDAIERDWKAAYESSKAARLESVGTTSNVVADISEVPDLKQWYDDATAALGGDETKSQERFVMAQQMDAHLKRQDDWQDRPQPERFAEVVKRVKAAFGELPAPEPAQSKDDIRKEIEKEIKKGKDESVPETLSDIQVGETRSPLTLDAVEKMSAGQLAKMNLSVADMEKIASQMH